MEMSVTGDLNHGESSDKILNSRVYFNYPDQREGTVVGILSKEGITLYKPSRFVEQCQWNYANHEELWKSVVKTERDIYKRKVGPNKIYFIYFHFLKFAKQSRV